MASMGLTTKDTVAAQRKTQSNSWDLLLFIGFIHSPILWLKD